MIEGIHRRGFAFRRTVLVALAAALLFASPALAGQPITPDDVEGPIVWGEATRVTHLRHLYFADQPDAVGFEAAKQAGVTTVIDLRAPEERDWDERVVVEGLGLNYFNVPIVGDVFQGDAFDEIERLVEAQQGEVILIHCSSSNRAGAWLAVHLVERHGLDEEEALAVGRRAGVTKEVIVERVHVHLAQPAK